MSLTELSEQITVVRALRRARLLYAAVPNGGRRDLREGRMLKASGVVAGVPDILIFTRPPLHPEKCGVALEMKRANGRPGDVSKEQAKWLAALEEIGWLCLVGYGAQNAFEGLRKMGFDVQAWRMDLHELIEAKGPAVVAHAMKSSVRRLREIAKGRIALTVDDLFELDKSFGRLFDLEQTILILGRVRDMQRRSRKYSPKAKPTLMTTLGAD